MHAKHKDGYYAKLVERPDGKLMRYIGNEDLTIAMAETRILIYSTIKEELKAIGWTILPDTLETLSVGQMVENTNGDRSKVLSESGFGASRVYGLSRPDDHESYDVPVTAKELKDMGYTVVQPEPTPKPEVEAAKKLLEAEGWKVSR